MKVFITGGTSGIGLDLVRYYYNLGAVVGLTGRDLSKVNLDEFDSKKVKGYQVDVTDKNKMNQVIDDFYSFYSDGLDIVYANAGISVGVKTSLPDFELGQKVIETNVLGLIYTFSKSVEYMKKQKSGSLVAISSVAGFVGLPGAGFYSASKSAVTKLCESLALDLAPLGINVTTICPGFIKTPLTDKNNHKMPFLMSSHRAVEKIAKAVEKGKKLYVFPWQMKVIIGILEKMPRGLYRFVMSIKMFDYRTKKRRG